MTLTSSNPSVASVPASVSVPLNQATATFTVATSAVTGTTPVDISASFSGATQHAVLTVTLYAVQGKTPLEPRWAGSATPLQLASLAPRLDGVITETSLYHPAGELNLHLAQPVLDEDLEPEGSRSIEAATFPGPPKRNFLYSPEMSLLESELSTPRDQKILYEYIWFNAHPVAQIDGQTVTHWTFTDHLGTPLIQTTASQAVWWRAEYEPYGRVWAYNPTGLADQHQPLRLPGHEAEQFNLLANGASERSYNVFRWYRGGWGRYTQPDPIGLDVGDEDSEEPSGIGVNLYGYAAEDPTIGFDPLGLQVNYCCGAPPALPPIAPILDCIVNCLGHPITVTSTHEPIPQHPPGSPHRRHEAADIRYPSDPNKTLCCAAECGAGFGLDEKKHPSAHATAPHIHVQVGRGKRGGRGDLPKPDPNCGCTNVKG